MIIFIVIPSGFAECRAMFCLVFNTMSKSAIKKCEIIKVKDGNQAFEQDLLAIEEPLEVKLVYGSEEERKTRNIAVTMRTPGNDFELALGFLFTEGIIKSVADITESKKHFITCAENKENTITIGLKEHLIPSLSNMERNFYTTSSCGVCGKASLNAVKATVPQKHKTPDTLQISATVLHKLPQALLQQQKTFEETGGLHASAIFGTEGNLMLIREDVGRHNALDKVLGAALLDNMLPLKNHILLLSGRISFELMQKAAMAGIPLVAGAGAPSSLALELAREFDITLAGFLNQSRFNIYHAAQRIILSH